MKTFSESLLAQTGSGTIYNDGKVHVYFNVHDGTRAGKQAPMAHIYTHYDLPLHALKDEPGATSIVIRDEAGKNEVRFLHEVGNHHGIGPWRACRETVVPHLPPVVVQFCDRLAPLIDQVVSDMRNM